MSRFLIVVPPLHGHVNPTVAVGTELSGRGHDVAWCGYPPVLEGLLPPGAEIMPVDTEGAVDLIETVEARSKGLRGAMALKFFWEEFLAPLAHAMIPEVDRAVERFEPDVMMVDQQTVAGAFVALRHRLPWATSATTSAELVDPFEDFPQLQSWADNCLVQIQLDHGESSEIASAARLRFSEHLVLAFTTPALAGQRVYPTHWKFVGPAFGGRPEHDPSFPWEWLDHSKPHVLVSLGTVNADSGSRFYRVVADAVSDRSIQVVVAAPPDVAGAMPDNVMVRQRVPQLELLRHMDAVVSHGGHNTVCESLANGVPLVVAPIRDDQPVIAAQVVASGSGIRVKFVRVNGFELGLAIDTVLSEPSYRQAAQRIRTSFASAGGAVVAADHLEKLAIG
jgi:MGT family glycosyltransferase